MMKHPAASTASFPLAFGVGTLWFEESRQDISRKIVNGIKTALEVGYRHIDSAQSKPLTRYGLLLVLM